MQLTVTPEKAPLHVDEDGVARIDNSRVTLDTIVGAFQAGASAEEIAQQYPSVSLADIYAVIAYYLHRQPEVDEYLRERRTHAARVRNEVESRADLSGIRARLLARRNG